MSCTNTPDEPSMEPLEWAAVNAAKKLTYGQPLRVYDWEALKELATRTLQAEEAPDGF